MANISSTLSFQDQMSAKMESIARKLDLTATEAKIAKANLDQLENAQKQWKITLDQLEKAEVKDKNAIANAREEYLKALREYDNGVLKVQKYESQLAQLEQQQKRNTQGFESMAGKIVTLSASFQLFNQAVGFIKGVNAKINEYVAQTEVEMRAQDQLSIITKQRMGLMDEEVRSLIDLASAQQKVGVVGDEVTVAGMAGIAAFVNQKSSIETLTPALDNLAVKMYGYNTTAESMDMISKSLGKAMLGDVGALSRMGVKIDDVTKKRLMSLKEEERAVELAKIIKNVTGDMNEEMAKSPFGQIAQANNRLSDSYEKLGAVLLPLQAVFTEVWSNIASTVIEHLDYIVPIVTVALGAIGVAFTVMKWKAISAWIGAMLPVAAVIGGIVAISGVLKLLGVDFTTQGKAIMNIFFMIGNIVQDIGIVIANFFRSIYNGAINVINLKNRLQGKELLQKKEYTDLKGWDTATETTEKISKMLKGSALTDRALLGKNGSGGISGLDKFSDGSALKTKQQGDITIADNDIELLNDIATKDFAQYYQQLTPNLTIPSMVIHETADVNEVIGAVTSSITGFVKSSTYNKDTGSQAILPA